MREFKATMILMAYNQQNVVAEAITSILEQNCDPIEILISDDASTDKTWEVITAIVNEYTGPHCITLNQNTTNLGLINHYNQCFAEARGKIMIICGGDDVSESNRAHEILSAFEKHEILMVCSDIDIYTLNDQTAARKYIRKQPLFFSSTNPRAACTSRALFVGATGAYHKSLFSKYGPLPKDDCYEDLILGFRASLEKKVFVINEKLVRYRLGGISTSQLNATDKKIRLQIKVREAKKLLTIFKQRLHDLRLAPSPTPIIRLKILLKILETYCKLLKFGIQIL